MAKSTPDDWLKARALFEAGKPVREIQDETGIPFNTVNYRAKKEGWKKSKLVQVIADRARVLDEVVQQENVFVQLNQAEQNVVLIESERLRNFRKRRDKIADLAYDRLEKEIPDCGVQFVKLLIEAADKVSVMVGDNPRFNPNAATNLTNINAQQNNPDSVQDEIISKVLNG
jgi:ribosomal protein S11